MRSMASSASVPPQKNPRMEPPGTIDSSRRHERHPYTRGLLASIPRLDSTAGQRLVPIQGQPPDLARLPPGCAFAPRCQHADAQCSASRPLLRTLEPGHLAACHHDHAIDAVLQPPQAHAA